MRSLRFSRASLLLAILCVAPGALAAVDPPPPEEPVAPPPAEPAEATPSPAEQPAPPPPSEPDRPLTGDDVRVLPPPAPPSSRAPIPPAPAPDPVPRRATYLWYARLGAGAVLGSDAGLGTGFGLGLRYEQSSVAVDLSVEMLSANDEGAPGDEVGSGGAKLRALYFTDASSSSSPYVGAGLGYGIVHRDSGDVLHEGSGLQGEISAGYEILRHERAIRLFLQADASLPFYLAEGSVFLAEGSQDADALYLPTFMLSLGAALGQ